MKAPFLIQAALATTLVTATGPIQLTSAATDTQPATHSAPKPAAMTNPFFAMDTATRDDQHTSIPSQLGMLKRLGLAGWSAHEDTDLAATLKTADALDLKLFAVYCPIDLDNTDAPHSPQLPEVIRQLRNRDTVIWLYLLSKKHPPSTDTVDEEAVRAVRRVARMTADAHLDVALYPHFGFYVATTRDAIRLVRKVDRPNVGLTFNLCHWLRCGGKPQELDALLRDALPYLHIVTINGADTGGTTWDRLIQPLGEGDFDVEGLLARLQKLGFRGPVGLQGYGLKGPAEPRLKQAVTVWRNYVRRIERQAAKP